MTEQRSPGHRHSATAVSGEEFVAAWKRNAAKLSSQGLYDPAEEHDACGVGLLASPDRTPRPHAGVAGLRALQAVSHRGPAAHRRPHGHRHGPHTHTPGPV